MASITTLAERFDALFGPTDERTAGARCSRVVEHGVDVLVELLFAVPVSVVDV